MSIVIRQEAMVFLQAVLHGVFLTLLYDLFRILRRIVRHCPAVVSAEDLLYWMTAGAFTFLFALKRTDGIVRGYTALGIVLGSVLYYEICSSRLVNTAVRVIEIPYKTIPVFYRKKGMKGGRQNEETKKPNE